MGSICNIGNSLIIKRNKVLGNTYLMPLMSLKRNEPGTFCYFVYSLGVRIGQTDRFVALRLGYFVPEKETLYKGNNAD